MATLALRRVTKTFKDVRAVDHLDLEIGDGELVCLLGASGCGKTTTLRIIAGLEPVDTGQIWLGGDDVSRVPIHRRDIGVVFQNYALFPHMTVAENISFGLRMRRRARSEIRSAVAAALELVRLSGYDERYPRQLSGGQQQRVALARALAIRPRLLLLDEPLSNLDAKLREEMRDEIRRIQRSVGITTLFVTHDQEEALSMADRIAVMKDGKILQIGRPLDIYERPANPFVASFIGQANLLRGHVVDHNADMTSFETNSGVTLAGEASSIEPGSRCVSVIKYEQVRISAEPSESRNCLSATIEFRTYLGGAVQYVCSVGQERFGVRQANHGDLETYDVGAHVYLSWRPEDCRILADL